MGLAAWAAVGRALSAAIVAGTIFGRGGALRLAAQQISAAILEKEFEVAEAMLRDMRRNHRSDFEAFVRKYKDDLPPEFLDSVA